MTRSVDIQRGENIVEDDDVGLGVDRSSQGYTSLQYMHQYLNMPMHRTGEYLLTTAEKQNRLCERYYIG